MMETLPGYFLIYLIFVIVDYTWGRFRGGGNCWCWCLGCVCVGGGGLGLGGGGVR